MFLSCAVSVPVYDYLWTNKIAKNCPMIPTKYETLDYFRPGHNKKDLKDNEMKLLCTRKYCMFSWILGLWKGFMVIFLCGKSNHLL